ncbi:MAG: MarR family transcriptional regulator [Eggerthellaceae bacterium]|jgi:DNA-binding MarR family transcriptional regulator|nr:MarR family transcriptional regulator [Eggerthellaceae bacterium]MCH4221747.1 MarR family transcriptional regulator [Eggerthellaceae bacterium]
MTGKELGPRFKRINEALIHEANQQLATSGLTFSQAMLLTIVSRHDGVCSQCVIERELCIAHPTVTGLVKRLAVKGYVTTFVSDQDARIKMVKITPSGQDAISHGEECRAKAERRLSKGMSQTEVETLGRLLDIVSENLK